MSYSKLVVSNTRTIREVCRLYRDTLLTQEQIAIKLLIGHGSVHEIVRRNFTAEEKKALKAKRYRMSKLGELNPMLGEKPGNFVGPCEDGHGYLTRVVDGERYFVHRIVMAELLCLHPSQLPDWLPVHHIDENKKNNSPDNLALVTQSGHRKLHRRR